MKIVHLSTYDSGGAGIAAYNLHLSLVSKGINSTFIVLYQTNQYAIKLKRITPPKSNYLQKALNYLGYPQTIQQKNYTRIKNKTAIGAPFSFPISNIDLNKIEEIEQADIINLHWVADFLDWNMFFKTNKKPIVWTLHDMNPFMGGFHYTVDLEQNNSSLVEYEKSVLESKIVYIEEVANLNIVSPSKWLMDISAQSKMFCKYNHYNIPYSINLDSFDLLDKLTFRKKYNLPENKIIFTFVSEDINNYRKGYDLLISVIQKLVDNPDIFFCAIGKIDNIHPHPNIKYFGKITDSHMLNSIYSLSDALILPSREDNLPNVMLESMACGTPVLSFRTGGMLDVIKNYFNGLLCEEMSIESLFDTIKLFCENINKFERIAIRQYCQANFSFNKQALAYINLYNGILTN